MSQTNIITELIGIKDKNIKLFDKLTYVCKKGVRYKVLYGRLTYTPTVCPVCGCINENYSIIKNGSKTSNIKLLPVGGEPVYLNLKKQRFLCKNCNKTFMASTSLVDSCCHISRQIKLKILGDLKMKVSEKDIANMNFVSHSTVSKMIDAHFIKYHARYDFLPEHLSMDEFKSTRDAEGSMSYIYIDGETHKIIDILENRQKHKLVRYFMKFTKEARENVKTVTCDLYAPYISLVKEVFPNAEIAVDRFHVVQLISKAFNQARIRIMNTFPKRGREYKRIKRYWKLLLKKRSETNYVYYHKWTHFDTFQSEASVIDNIISLDPELKLSYTIYQKLLIDIESKDYNSFYAHIEEYKEAEVGHELKTAFYTYRRYKPYIKNALKYTYSNGPIEGINNYIKVLKRVAFGYKSFFHFRNRILISRNIMQPMYTTNPQTASLRLAF